MADSQDTATPHTHPTTEAVDEFETFGYDSFPDRDPVSITRKEAGSGSALNGIRDAITGKTFKSLHKIVKCQKHVIDCVENNLLVKLMISALKSRGCEFSLSRHVSCEPCAPIVNGGYDGVNNQVVVCANNSTKLKTVCSVLGHELIHAFDNCRAELDFKNIDHLACTEIRAANIMHCRLGTAMVESLAHPFGKSQQQNCVKWKARNSVLAVRNVSKEEAEEAVERVFDKCYPDLEPVGRIPHNPHQDARRLYVEASLYGYTEL